MKREKDSVRLKKGQAGGGGRIALITSARAQRHCTNYGPHLSFHARSAFPISLPSSAGSKVSLEPTTLKLVPWMSSLQGTGQASRYGTLVASAESRGTASLMDRYPGSYYLFRALQETWLVVYPGVGREYFQSSFGTWARLGAGRIRFLL